MKRLLITLGIMLGAVILFILGLFPAESILTSGAGTPSESYVLIATGRGAAFITALFEFAIGYIVAALWMKRPEKKKTEQSG
jgi:membrane protein DedA with SNARE-associated domain